MQLLKSLKYIYMIMLLNFFYFYFYFFFFLKLNSYEMKIVSSLQRKKKKFFFSMESIVTLFIYRISIE